MHPVQTFSRVVELPDFLLKTFRCRKQVGLLQRKQRPPSAVANSREHTEQRHLMDSEAVTFD